MTDRYENPDPYDHEDNEPIIPPPADPEYRWYVTSGNGRIMADLPDMDNAIDYVTEAGYDQYSSPVVRLDIYLDDDPVNPLYHIVRLSQEQIAAWPPSGWKPKAE